ncbi:GNAT family N-acetyltransferase [Actinopolymorpha alba]|uniref:GNAT family N-acetyltransferase n=1 Tax=Actinopolymorpha alba TaxID=533267 RepID=UPI0004763855|nr:GNAT family protein [Actinopolymorpha alba]
MPSVRLEPLRITDWMAVHSWAKLPEACRYQPYGPDTEEQTQGFVKAAVNAWTDSPQKWFVYAARVDGQILGLGQLNVEDRHRQGEISYVVHPLVWGRGIGTEIGSGLLTIGFEEMDLHRIYGTCDPRNLASAGVLKKLGMTYEGRMRHTMLIRDGWRDSELFSILEDEWSARP